RSPAAPASAHSSAPANIRLFLSPQRECARSPTVGPRSAREHERLPAPWRRNVVFPEMLVLANGRKNRAARRGYSQRLLLWDLWLQALSLRPCICRQLP